MNFITLICVACVMSVRADVIIDGVRHRAQILYQNVSYLAFLRIDYTSNNLYFRDGNSVGRLNLITTEFNNIEVVNDTNIIDLTIDQATQTVYIGTKNGLYKYIPGSDKAEVVGLQNVTVWTAYFIGALYYTEYKSSTVNIFRDGQSTMFVELDDVVNQLLIYNEDIIYYSNGGVLYRHTNGKRDVVLYMGDGIHEIQRDINGKVYFCTTNAIYQIFTDRDAVRRVVTIDRLHSMVFDNENNIIYADHNNNINRLVPVHEVTEKLDYIDTKFDILEKKMDKMENKMTVIFLQLLNCTISTGCSPRNDHLDLRNVPISVDEAQEEQVTST